MKEKEGMEDGKELTQKFTFDPKQGIDNPALSLADDVESGAFLEPRFCSLVKDDRGTFGFFLRQELCIAGHVIRQVEAGGPAQRSGLRDGDRLLEVNGEYVDDMSPLRVVQKVKASGSRVCLAVLDEMSYLEAKARHLNMAMLLPACTQPLMPSARPRLCHIHRDKGGFGFSISALDGEMAPFHLVVTSGGPAEAAGLPPGSRLFELNGVSVCNLTKTQLNKKLKQAGPAVVVLVMEPDSEDFYSSRGLKVTAAMADPSTLPFKARKLHMVKGADGYGFLLRQEKYSSKTDGQFLREVDVGLPAEKAGMREGDRLLAVNGHIIEGLEHDDVVRLICASGNQVTLLVIECAGDQFYSTLGLSPLLFYEDAHLGPPATPPPDDQPQPAMGHSGQQLDDTSQPRPRLCHLTKETSGYGLQLGNIADEEEIFVTQVVPEGSAHQAGLREGDRVIEVNGTNMEKRRYEEVIGWLKEEDTGRLALLVVDQEGYEYCRNRGIAIRADMVGSDGAGWKGADPKEVQGREE